MYASFFNVGTFFVLLAAFMDIAANMLLAASQGFRRKFHGMGSLLLVGIAFYFLSLAVRDMDLAIAYALWGSFGLLGTALGGWIFFRQKLNFYALFGVAIQITGIILLHI